MKTELLIQMDGVTAVNSSVFVMAASNLPWDLDVALLRRLEKRLMIGLPELEAREVMVRKHLADRSSLTNADYTTIGIKLIQYLFCTLTHTS
jgi:katanin p60 ATPase-containing subunit A1